jgi:hypothetical protein
MMKRPINHLQDVKEFSTKGYPIVGKVMDSFENINRRYSYKMPSVYQIHFIFRGGTRY